MSNISPLLRRQIDTIAYELIAVSEMLRPTSPALADVYLALGQGIESSHYQHDWERHLRFDFPQACELSISGNKPFQGNGPVSLRLGIREVQD
jgi:hypothetical protein